MKSYARYIALALAFGGGAFAATFVAQAQSPAPAPAPAQGQASPGGFPVLGKTLWVIQTKPTGNPRSQPAPGAHMRHQADLEKRGIMFGAGPATALDGDDNFGLIIIRAADEAEARRIADSDPMHSTGTRAYKLYRWMLNEGTISVRVNFAEGSFVFD